MEEEYVYWLYGSNYTDYYIIEGQVKDFENNI
jgi:hypothetical protein